MLTRNGLAVSNWVYPSMRTLKSVNGDIVQSINFAQNSGNYLTTMAVQFGSGNTAPTPDDYHIETPVSGITITSKTDTVDKNNRGWNEGNSYFGVFAIRNDNPAAITVSELGLYITVSNVAYLLTRDIFTPTVLEPGEIYTFSVTVK